MPAATYDFTTVLQRNLTNTPRGLDNVYIATPIWVDSVAHPLVADSYKLMTITAQTICLTGTLVVQTVEVAADTIAVGDVTTNNRWLAATAINALGATSFTGAAIYYAAADELQITASAAITAAKFWIGLVAQYLQTT